MNAIDPERYRFAADSLQGVATVAILCASCHDAGGDEPVIVFDFLFPSLGDVQAAIDAHETGRHGGGR